MEIAFDGFTVSEYLYPPGVRQSRHAHDYGNITVITRGLIEEGSDSGEFRAGPSAVVLKAAGCEHDDRVSRFGARTIAIRFAPESRMIPANAWRWLDDANAARCALDLQRAFALGSRDAIERAAAVLIEEVNSRRKETRAPEWIAHMKSVLETNFDDSLRFDGLARDFGLHPVYASRAFRRHTGISMTDYVRNARVRHAMTALSLTKRSIAAIAGESGFADQSHLTRTFVRFLGMTPKSYRRILEVKPVQLHEPR